MTDFSRMFVNQPEVPDGKVNIRNHWLSVDTYMSGRMNDAKGYAQPYALSAQMIGGAVGAIAGGATGHAIGEGTNPTVAVPAETIEPEAGTDGDNLPGRSSLLNLGK